MIKGVYLTRHGFNPEISLIYLTYRPGGIDLLAMSLMAQSPNYELIVIDGYPGRTERGKAIDYLLAHGIPLRFFGPPKEKSYPDTPVNLANAMNTGAIYASAPLLVFVHDFVVFEASRLLRWVPLFRENGLNCLISGIAQIYNSPQPTEANDVSVWSDDVPLQKRLMKKTDDWIPEEFENFYFGCPATFFERINGIDERADVNIAYCLTSMMTQAKLHNYRLLVNRQLKINMIDHHNWKGDCWHHHKIRTGMPSLITDVLQMQPAWGMVSPNPYNFSECRRDFQQERMNRENY